MEFVRQQDVHWIEGERCRKKILLRDDTLNAPGEVHNTKTPTDAPYTYVVFITGVLDNDRFRQAGVT